jgi:hypothetical protein
MVAIMVYVEVLGVDDLRYQKRVHPWHPSMGQYETPWGARVIQLPPPTHGEVSNPPAMQPNTSLRLRDRVRTEPNETEERSLRTRVGQQTHEHLQLATASANRWLTALRFPAREPTAPEGRQHLRQRRLLRYLSAPSSLLRTCLTRLCSDNHL